MKTNGWNRPDEKVSGGSRRVVQTRRHLIVRGLIAALIIVVGAIFAWIVLKPSNIGQKKLEGQDRRLIKAVKPASSAKLKSKTNQKSEKAEKKAPPKPYRDQYGNLWLEKGRPYIDPNAKLVEFDNKEPLEKVFKHTCNIRIGQMLSIEPGTEVEQQVFGDWFRQDFQDSIATKIEILPDDDEYTRNVKEAVIDVRKELIERTKKGEDVAKIMTDTWEELYQLGRFKSELNDALLKLSENNDASEDDVKTLIEATDKMLEQKGLPPFQNKRMIERMMRFNIRNHKEEQE